MSELNHKTMPVRIPRLLFAAPASGTGKTMITCAFLQLMKCRGIRTVSYKCGPDYIDPLFHQYVPGIPGYNLDSFFLAEKQVKNLLMRTAGETGHQAELAVIEGVMGYYDGLAGISTRASSYDIARITETPVIMIVDAGKSSLSVAAMLQGFLQYRPDSRIAGVILNRTSGAQGERLRLPIESLGIQYLGTVPDCPQMHAESRHLGLTLPAEQDRLRERISQAAKLLEENLDIEGILNIAKTASEIPGSRPKILVQPQKTDDKDTVRQKRIAVAIDEAFCFYYQDNLDFLEELGYRIVPFSALHDRALPPDICAVIFGGGYPECYAKELSANTSMLESVRQAGSKESGVNILAECGGFMYLHETMEGMDGQEYPMTGLIRGKTFRVQKQPRFGYISLFMSGAECIRAHEFHRWDSTGPGTDMYAKKPLSERGWACMYCTDRMLAGFPHLYYRSGESFIRRFLGAEQFPR